MVVWGLGQAGEDRSDVEYRLRSDEILVSWGWAFLLLVWLPAYTFAKIGPFVSQIMTCRSCQFAQGRLQ